MGSTTPASSDDADAHLQRLQQWWRTELEEARAAQRLERSKRPLAERVAGGRLLSDLVFARREQRRSSAVGGYPALLWAMGETDAGDGSPRPHPEQPQQQGTIVRITANEVCMRLPRDYQRFVERGALHLERQDSEVTFQRGDAALRALADDAALDHKRALLFGDVAPRFEALSDDIDFRDEQLNAGQRHAVACSLRARDACLIHGPPGTGKTRTLVEVVRQALLRRRRILVTAASNIAVDNVARRLAACGVKVLRLGAVDTVAPDLAQCTLQHKMAALPQMAESQAHFDAAKRIADGKGRRLAHPGKRISELRRQAHSLRDEARAKVMRRARVVCATAGGVDAVPLGDERFDLVVLDEATQATDPVALAALVRGAVVVLAGDPQQLPPTVVARDEQAKGGLSSTLFERCAERWPAHATSMLTTQYRMSDELMRFPSALHYEGKLEAAKANRRHRLADLVAEAELSERDAQPWILVDTHTLGHNEACDAHSSSFYNDVHLQLVVRECRRLIAAGLAPHHIAAICPYAAQTRRARLELSAELEQGLEIGTVDGFQGREKEVVVVDLLRSIVAEPFRVVNGKGFRPVIDHDEIVGGSMHFPKINLHC
jgi:superfamily I DNA and/or RNA helicase